jgi:Domain of unknown function (DUF4806)
MSRFQSRYLKTIGGKNEGDFIRSAMQYVIEDEVLDQYSWTGNTRSNNEENESREKIKKRVLQNEVFLKEIISKECSD